MRGSHVEIPRTRFASFNQQENSEGLWRWSCKGKIYLPVGSQNVASQAAFAARLTRMLRRSEVHGRGSCNTLDASRMPGDRLLGISNRGRAAGGAGEPHNCGKDACYCSL
jgi:hypothetical protein